MYSRERKTKELHEEREMRQSNTEKASEEYKELAGKTR